LWGTLGTTEAKRALEIPILMDNTNTGPRQAAGSRQRQVQAPCRCRCRCRRTGMSDDGNAHGSWVGFVELGDCQHVDLFLILSTRDIRCGW
jgi:hypothetical protein